MSKSRDELFENFQLLDEGLLTSEFTFGFELEGIYKGTEIDFSEPTGDSDEDEEENSRELDELLDLINSKIEDEYKTTGESHIHVDCSVHPDRREGFPFEYSSAIFPCTPLWFSRVISALRDMMADDFYTNSSCGFHHHIKFKDMTERDMIWMYCNMASDPEFKKTFEKLIISDDEEYNLSSIDFARLDIFEKLKNNLDKKNYNQVLSLLSTEKWRAFRIHPQGTLEWRGPRNFMNTQSIDNINKFYMLFNKLIDFIKKYMDSKTLIGNPDISKKDLFDGLTKAVEETNNKPDSEFLYHSEGYDSGTRLNYKSDQKHRVTENTYRRLISIFKSNPNLLVNWVLGKPEKVIPLIKYIPRDTYDFGFLLTDYIQINMKKDDRTKEFVKTLIDLMEKNLSEKEFVYVINELDLIQHDDDLLKKAFLLSRDIYDWKKSFVGILNNKNIRLNLSEIEASIINVIKRRGDENTALTDFVSALFDDRIHKHIKKYIGKIILWIVKASSDININLRYPTYNENDIERVKKEIKKSHLVNEWDSTLINIIYSGVYSATPAFKYLINPVSPEILTKMYSRNSNIISYLSKEDKEKISSIIKD